MPRVLPAGHNNIVGHDNAAAASRHARYDGTVMQGKALCTHGAIIHPERRGGGPVGTTHTQCWLCCSLHWAWPCPVHSPHCSVLVQWLILLAVGGDHPGSTGKDIKRTPAYTGACVCRAPTVQHTSTEIHSQPTRPWTLPYRKRCSMRMQHASERANACMRGAFAPCLHRNGRRLWGARTHSTGSHRHITL